MTLTAIDAAATFREDPAKARSAPTVTATLANGRARLSAGSFNWDADLAALLGGENLAPSPTAYLLGAYQPARGDDGDPNSDRRIVLGISDLANTGSVTFAETIRDRADPLFGVCNPAAIVAHELAHLFGDTADLRNDGNGGLMSSACEAGTTTLVGKSLLSIRSASHP